MQKAKKLVVISTKGGCGKSTISNFIAPYYFIEQNKQKLTKENVNLSIIELEATNTSREEAFSESVVNYTSNKMIDNESVQDFFIDALFEDNGAIFDIGGGRDSLLAIKEITKVGQNANNFVFIFPFNLSQDSFDGAYETYKNIKKNIKNIRAVFVLNKMVYKFDDSDVPYKEFLDIADISKETERAGIEIDKIIKENVQLTYIPEFFESLPKKLFQSNGCCLDFCKQFIEGVSATEQRESALKEAKAFSSDKVAQKAYYKKELQEIVEASNMYKILQYSKPFFNAIDNALNQNIKIAEKNKKA